MKKYEVIDGEGLILETDSFFSAVCCAKRCKAWVYSNNMKKIVYDGAYDVFNEVQT